MASDSNINSVKESSSLEAKSQELSKKVEISKEVEKAAVSKEAYREAVSLDETAETTGRVSEVVQDATEQKGDEASSGSTGFQPLNPEEVRAKLLRNVPSERIMKTQIRREINKEIDYLHKKAIKLSAIPSGMSYFEMANLMKKIRELKGILLTLVKASLDSLKTLWLRFVHGVL